MCDPRWTRRRASTIQTRYLDSQGGIAARYSEWKLPGRQRRDVDMHADISGREDCSARRIDAHQRAVAWNAAAAGDTGGDRRVQIVFGGRVPPTVRNVLRQTRAICSDERCSTT